MFIASHHKLEPVSLMFPYDLIILNDTQDEPRNNPGLIGMKRISEKVVRVQAKPVRVIRALSDLNIRVKCFIGLAAGYSWSMMNYNGNIDMPGFFEFLSHVLCDEALYLADFDFVSHLLKGERYRFDQHDFPVANFSALPLEKDSVPFNIGVLPLTTEDFDDLPGADEPCIDENVPDPQRLRIFGLKKLPADTQTFVLGNIEVSLSNATVWDFETDFDCVVANPAPREMTEAFLPAKGKRDYIVNLDWFMKRPFVKFLEEADLEKWSSVGIGISMEKQFRPALMALKKWNKEFPKRGAFFCY
jgi:hypothetical protein